MIKKRDIALVNVWPYKVQEWGGVRRCSARSILSLPSHIPPPDFTLVMLVLYCANVIPVQTPHCIDNVFLLGFRRVCVEGFHVLSVRLSQSCCVMSEPVLRIGHAVDDI